jgi:hypothetical protein
MWFVFAVIFAVLPTFTQYLQELQKKNHHLPGLFELASQADLYIVCMGLTASAIGQSFMRPQAKKQGALLFWTVFNVVDLAVVTFLAAGANDKNIDKIAMGQQSLVLLIATLISTGCATYICELELAQ